MMKEGGVLKEAPVKHIREQQELSSSGNEPKNDHYLYKKCYLYIGTILLTF